jgi:hypothetical protein
MSAQRQREDSLHKHSLCDKKFKPFNPQNISLTRKTNMILFINTFHTSLMVNIKNTVFWNVNHIVDFTCALRCKLWTNSIDCDKIYGTADKHFHLLTQNKGNKKDTNTILMKTVKGQISVTKLVLRKVCCVECSNDNLQVFNANNSEYLLHCHLYGESDL